MIAVRSWERAKGLTRIEFVAGIRALADYRRASATARAVAALFSAARDDAAKLAARMVDENKELHRRLRALEGVAARAEAEELLFVLDREAVTQSSRGLSAKRDTLRLDRRTIPDHEGVKDETGIRIVAKVFDDRDADSLKNLALG
jgi:alanyl-tRNA synthetase